MGPPQQAYTALSLPSSPPLTGPVRISLSVLSLLGPVPPLLGFRRLLIGSSIVGPSTSHSSTSVASRLPN
jgi:hypothetical protein